MQCYKSLSTFVICDLSLKSRHWNSIFVIVLLMLYFCIVSYKLLNSVFLHILFVLIYVSYQDLRNKGEQGNLYTNTILRAISGKKVFAPNQYSSPVKRTLTDFLSILSMVMFPYIRPQPVFLRFWHQNAWKWQ